MRRGLFLRRQRRVTVSLAPLLSPYHLDTNPRRHPCCVHCDQWLPADCPDRDVHPESCPDCDPSGVA